MRWVIGVCGFAVSVAWACPDFSGFYLRPDGGKRDIRQVGCESLVITDTFGGISRSAFYPLNGREVGEVWGSRWYAWGPRGIEYTLAYALGAYCSGGYWLTPERNLRDVYFCQASDSPSPDYADDVYVRLDGDHEFAYDLAIHCRRHPRLEARDIYKFVHQSVFGPGHIMPDRESAHRYLDAEASIAFGYPRGNIQRETLSDWPGLVRLHIGPIIHQVGGVASPGWTAARECILDAMERGIAVSAAQGSSEGISRMQSRLESARQLIQQMGQERRDTLTADLNQLESELYPLHFPPVHHSAIFNELYRPSYRVVDAAAYEACSLTE